ncbi:MAG TPA: hypothetical protein VMY78_01620 [Solirubrobacteraceae bacterium]|nr:hypothetical protein [Solirubrobacteraceae bacterium]
MRSLRAQSGQATVDYVALVALVAAVVAVGGALAAVASPGIANAVLGQVRHALCIVGGGSCPMAPSRPCTVASDRDSRHVAVNVALLRVDDGRVVLRERLSDGTFRLTLVHRGAAGVETGAGGGVEVEVRGRSIGRDREARAGVQGVLARGEVFYARSQREADALLRAIRDGRGAPPPREVFVEGGVRGLGSLDFVAARGLSGQLDGLADAMVGARRDRRNGELTVSLGAGGSGAGLVSIAVGGPAGALDGQAVLGLTLDRRRRAVELSLSATGNVAAGSTLPGGLARALDPSADPGAALNARGHRWEVGARVDLRVPAVAAAWQAFRRAPASPRAIRALGEALRDHARLDVRAYRVHSTADGASAGLAFAGLKLGGEVEHTIDRSLLVSAATRPPFGLWEPRLDCVAV